MAFIPTLSYGNMTILFQNYKHGQTQVCFKR